MAFLLELIPIIAEAAEAGGAAATVAEAAAPEVASVAVDAGAAASEGAAAGVDTGAAGADAAADAAAQAVSKVPVFDMTTSGTTAGANAAREAIMQGAIQFGKWAANEAAKQALFYAGMKAAGALFQAAAASSPNDPAIAALAAKFNQTTAAVNALHTTTQDWAQWSTAHYDNRASYGTVNAAGANLTRFEILQYNLGSLADALGQNVTPALVTFNTTKNEANLDTLRTALLAYAQNVKGQSDSITNNEQAMVSDGLQAHQSDVAGAITSLT
ncbi:uncharacterized protein CCOS01_08457 [Colletotrichum costaricense]|uniref:Uncharacterized protein n=1 Tax=Colletotrichum costaricense TaxID=1209916 RepID=A0AAI9YWP7_9PEZI|nr:uncharacterized protein CCOS01_08457 [Colletotrichum costaricense]KAK1526039.1 hypothetical protein CCOS01_08457 [Colletotrichum costaricense]